MLVEYETAVHYQTADGSWEEIDNTLQKTGQQYVAQAGDMTRKFAASLDSGFLFETAYQGQSVSMSLARRSSRDVVAVAPDVPAAEETAAPKKQRHRRPSTSRRRRSRRRQTFRERLRKPRRRRMRRSRRRMRRSRRRQRSCRCWTTRRIRWSRPRRRPGWKTRGQMRTFSKLAEKDKIQPQKIRSSVAFDNVMDGVSLLYQNYGYNVKRASSLTNSRNSMPTRLC